MKSVKFAHASYDEYIARYNYHTIRTKYFRDALCTQITISPGVTHTSVSQKCFKNKNHCLVYFITHPSPIQCRPHSRGWLDSTKAKKRHCDQSNRKNSGR